MIVWARSGEGGGSVGQGVVFLGALVRRLYFDVFANVSRVLSVFCSSSRRTYLVTMQGSAIESAPMQGPPMHLSLVNALTVKFSGEDLFCSSRYMQGLEIRGTV